MTDEMAAGVAEGQARVSGRYMRQLNVVGLAGQQALARARVLVVGAGGLGSPAAIYLASAGVGTLGLIDDDVVETSNLHRQPLHMTESVGVPKVESAAAHLTALNPDIHVMTHRERLTADNARQLLRDYDVVLDGADNFATRYIISDACRDLGIPHVWAAVLTTGGQMSVFMPHGPTYRDLYPVAPTDVPTCAEAGVLGVVPGQLGVAQAAEALKLITGLGQALVGQVGVYDMLTGMWEYVPLVGSGGASQSESHSTPQSEVRSVGVEEPGRFKPAEVAPAEIPAGAFVLDVREESEFDSGHVPGARLLPLSTIMDNPEGSAHALALEVEHTPDPHVFVMCQAGVRSQYAIQMFHSQPSMQHVRLTNVIGGMYAWMGAGLPVVQPAPGENETGN
ncbi:ThiF family adenylyltransferase [Brevibacterium paucivorans]|uniref:ThiF family adenylyltransferase n=1 Tax=Brevibacterium paucivorans TaxID=170994 RepID=UPI0025DFE4CB|nr:ThiF family adenylyltransferase [uncultured Brevibacterium sp.]